MGNVIVTGIYFPSPLSQPALYGPDAVMELPFVLMGELLKPFGSVPELQPRHSLCVWLKYGMEKRKLL